MSGPIVTSYAPNELCVRNVMVNLLSVPATGLMLRPPMSPNGPVRATSPTVNVAGSIVSLKVTVRVSKASGVDPENAALTTWGPLTAKVLASTVFDLPEALSEPSRATT